MATLTGKLADVTSKTPENISSITVKAPSARIGSGTDVIVSSPAKVTFNKTTGAITISGLTGGLSWLHIEGDGWTDSIALSVAEGMVTVVEAVANAAGTPGLADYIALLVNLQSRIDDMAQGSIDSALGTKADKTYVDSELGTKADKTYVDSELGTKADKTYVDGADQALGQQIEDGAWFHPLRIVNTDVDTLRGSEAVQRIYPVSDAAPNIPIQSSGWVLSLHDRGANWDMQVYISSSRYETGYWTRKWGGGQWQDWKKVDPQAVEGRVSDLEENAWLHPLWILYSSVDTLREPHQQRIYRVGAGAPGLPVARNGWLLSLHDDRTGRMFHTYWSSYPDETGYWTRKHDGTDWSPWKKIDYVALEQRVKSLETGTGSTLASPPVTTWETAEVLTTYEQGERYLDLLAAQMPLTERITVGTTGQGRDITGVIIGDQTKPKVLIECGVHGDEVSSRESALIWARKIARDWPAWMEHLCVVIIPTVNADMITLRRWDATGKDINRSFADQSTPEARALISAVETYEPIFYLNCHETASATHYQAAGMFQEWLSPHVRTVSERVFNRVMDLAEEIAPSVGVYPSSFQEGDPPSMASRYMSTVMDIPVVLIEIGSVLGPTSWTGPGAHPNRYKRPLDMRIGYYLETFDTVMDELATIVQEQESQV